jgi:hypothetical protein
MAFDHICEPCYPQEIPQEAIRYVLGALTGGEAETSCLVHCGWVVLGYGLGLGLPHPCPVLGATADPGAELQGHLEKALAVGADPDAAAVPWDRVVVLVVELIRLWLARK